MSQTNSGIGSNFYTTGMPQTTVVSTNVTLTNFVNRSETAGYDGYVTIYTGKCRILAMTAYNSSGSTRAIQVHDSAGQPTNGEVPINLLVVPTTGQASLSMGEAQYQRVFNGLTIASSSTIPTYTATGTPDVFIVVSWVAF